MVYKKMDSMKKKERKKKYTSSKQHKKTTKSNSRNCLFTLFMQYFRANDCYISLLEFPLPFLYFSVHFLSLTFTVLFGVLFCCLFHRPRTFVLLLRFSFFFPLFMSFLMSFTFSHSPVKGQ